MTSIFRKLAMGSALAVALAASAMAADVSVNATTTGLTLRGYDPVSYFTAGAPAKGDFQITSEYGGAVYRFASEDNKAMFDAEPAKYAPQYGGYCAMGAAMGIKLDGDPDLWKIVNDKLYLNVAPPVAEKWSSDPATYIEQADARWPEIVDAAPEDLQP